MLNNRFVTFGNPVLYAKSTADLPFEGNKVAVCAPDSNIPTQESAIAGYLNREDRSQMGMPESQIILKGFRDVAVGNNMISE